MASEHSRLLKYLLPADSILKMSEKYTLKVEFINPTNIESEVPGNQKLREPIENENSTGNDGVKNYVPVMTVKKEEAVFTKSTSDLKLQKVSVTEDISENEEKKLRSRIPKMRFRQAAEKVKKERRRSNEEQEPHSPAALLRRSSIPRLKRRTGSTTETSNIEEPKATADTNEQTESPEDEFDKIFDEIIHTANTTPIVDTTLDKVKIDDAEELEHSFEEIIHDYEENKVQPIDVKKVRSRITLVKQKSLPEEKFAKKLDRRLSLKSIPFDDDDNAQSNVVKSDENGKNTDSVDDNTKGNFTETKEREVQDVNQVGHGKKETVKVVTPILRTTETKAPKNDDVDKIDIPTNKNEEFEPVSESQMPDSSKLVKQINMVQNKNSDDSNKPLVANGGINNRKYNPDKAEDKERNRKIPVLKGKVSQLVNKITSTDESSTAETKKDIASEAPKKKSIMSKIAVFNKDKDDNTDRPNDFRKIKTFSNINHLRKLDDDYDKTNTPEKLHEDAYENLNSEAQTAANNISPPNTPMHSITEPGKDNMIKENVMASPKTDEYMDTPVEDSILDQESEEFTNKNNPVEEVDPAIEFTKEKHKIEVESIELQTPEVIYSDESPLEAYNNNLNVEAVNKEIEEDFIPKGKVSSIIHRIISQEDTLETKKEAVIEVPIKKSVSSRIAMFERQTTVDNSPHMPRIIDEVLKAQPPRNMETNNYQNANIFNNETEVSHNDDNHNFLIDNSLEIHRQASIIVDETIQHVSYVIDVQTSDEESNCIEISEEFNNDYNDKDLNITSKGVTKEIATDNDLKTKQNPDEREFKPRMNEYLKVEDRLKRMQSRHEDVNIKKTKSTADLHIEEAVKGKVHQMIVRMNSVEKLVEKRTPISVKEQPRKRSVLEKIALFEQKLISSDTMNSTSTLRPPVAPTVGPVAPNAGPITALSGASIENSTTEEVSTSMPFNEYSEKYKAKIEGLLSAKATYGVMKDMQYITLANGKKMPVLALGTALMDPTLLPYIIGAAIDLGFRAIDTAYIYGNEEMIGNAIRAKIEDGTVKREDLFIIGKLWSTFHRRDLVPRACADSLRNLRLDYFDLYLVHNPMSFKEGGDPLPRIANVLQYSDVDYLDAWYGMEDLVGKGLAKSIGVSNFNSVQIGRLVDKGRVKPVINQVECHPYLNQQRLHNFCADRGVKLMCFGTLGSKGTPQEYKATSLAAIDDPLVKVMAAGVGATPAQLLIKYQLSRGHAVVVKSSSAAHLWDNLQALNTKLRDTEADAIHTLNTNKRTFVFMGMGDTHKNYPFKIPF